VRQNDKPGSLFFPMGSTKGLLYPLWRLLGKVPPVDVLPVHRWPWKLTIICRSVGCTFRRTVFRLAATVPHIVWPDGRPDSSGIGFSITLVSIHSARHRLRRRVPVSPATFYLLVPSYSQHYLQATHGRRGGWLFHALYHFPRWPLLTLGYTGA